MAKIEGTVTAGNGLKVRSAPEASAATVAAALPYLTKITGEEVTNSLGEVWIKLATVNGQVVGYVGYSSRLYIRVDRIIPDEEPPVEPVFPDWFDLTDPQGNKQRYNRA